MKSFEYRILCRECKRIFEMSFPLEPQGKDIPDSCYPCWAKIAVKSREVYNESENEKVSSAGGFYVRNRSGAPEPASQAQVVSFVSRTGKPGRSRVSNGAAKYAPLTRKQESALEKLIAAIKG
jgi:hypothetical protein